MTFFSRKSFHVLCAFFALFVITGDLIADGVHDATDACVTESQGGGCDSCPACLGCPIHTAAALAADSGSVIVPELGTGDRVWEAIEQRAIGSPPAIDHPPQLC